MKKFAAALLLSTLGSPLVLPALAQSEGAELAQLGFVSTDVDANEFLSMAELQDQGALIFLSMDENDNQSLTQSEFLSWGFGLQNFAEDTGSVQGYETALKFVFSLWDRNKDGALTPLEHRQGISLDTVRADLDLDGRLSESEYLGSFVINVALRAALKQE